MSWREDENDREIEAAVADLAKRNWKCALQKTELGCPFDFKAIRAERLVALVEVRRRNNKSTDYQDIFMSKAKWTKLQLFGQAYEVPVLFVVVFDDAVGWIDLTLHPRLKTTYASRGPEPKGGARATDNEEAVLIPVSKMRLLEPIL